MPILAASMASIGMTIANITEFNATKPRLFGQRSQRERVRSFRGRSDSHEAHSAKIAKKKVSLVISASSICTVLL
jgi:hypothetical protein